MSGLDEQRAAPECPQCNSNNEWYLGGQQWLLTADSMRSRKLKYPLICHRADGPSAGVMDSRFMCIPCCTFIERDGTIGKALYRLFLQQRGETYISDMSSKSERVWEE